ncbi:putative IMP4-component of the U3 small nucleolar ribonucleo protein [Tilletiopsis washingtonensis]|uniref:U3 small nucleolar ribonucleoprotein protein IMP4 n=1 Tax=Tilletiopsis washingtonensis TaxID=58919 RepID=A0A316Z413_9BASI|nr:putative IMP4-component of the U3 small nucleolar ribonucleo protein [Tilletiopsis washingtonensis]PWN95652.1 putative IMP4-component of the U3 small nucleolar ribonucleo protein [Tilletiopsis washingtonensis]
MLRRLSRERREYIYRKSQESKEHEIFERKQKIRQLLAEGKPVPRNLTEGLEQEGRSNFGGMGGAAALRVDEGQTEPGSSIDSEYARAGQYDPKVLITTSRDPSSRLTQFAKELRLCIPNSTRINRGGYTVNELGAACRSNGMTDLLVVHEHRGVPDALVLSHFPHGPTLLFTLNNVVLRHEVSAHAQSTVSEQYPHLIFEGFNSKLGTRVGDALKYLFPVPKEDSKRVMTFSNERDFISFRHHVFLKTSHREVQLAEVGPRFEMRPYEIRQGTLEQSEADVEWVLRPFMNSGRKKNQL